MSPLKGSAQDAVAAIISIVAARYLFAPASSGGPNGPGDGSRQPPGSDDPDDPTERLGFFLARVPLGALALNPRAEIVECNSTALNLLGLTHDQLIGKTCVDLGWDVIHEDGSPFPAQTGPVPQAIRELRMVGGVIIGLSRPRRGDRVWLELHVHPRLTRSGELREVICLFRDITERHLRQAAERRADEAERRREEAERRLQEGPLERALPGDSPAIIRLREEVQEAAHTLDDLPVLILGEPGTGKTLVARTLHDVSSRRAGQFESVDCSSISPSLFESEVFGHEKGAFTGATASRPGRFELAHSGTLFLDEVGDFPIDQQPKLLVALQEHRVRRLGAKADVTVEIAVVAATNHDLPRMVAEGRFRADLYDRLNGVTIHVPPLRDRSEDIGVLVDQFVRSAAGRKGATIRDVDPEVLAVFRRFDWPGNVRQLHQIVRQMVGRAKGDRLTEDLVPEQIRATYPPQSGGAEQTAMLSKERIEEALAKHGGNVRRTAEQLGISRTRLYRLMEKHGIRRAR